MERSHVSIETEDDVRYWTKSLDTTIEDVRAAIAAVGTTPEHVRDFVAGLRWDVGDEIIYQGRQHRLTDSFRDEQGRRFFWLDGQPPPILEHCLRNNLDAD